jgi:futalosine hydrolase
VYGDVGFELPDEPGFRHINEAPFGAFYAAPFALEPDAAFTVEGHVTRLGRGCTVNACAGTDATGRRREQLFAADFETMEGAAVAQAGAAFGVPVCEIRAISNVAARRDMRPENITRALDALTRYLRACRESERD